MVVDEAEVVMLDADSDEQPGTPKAAVAAGTAAFAAATAEGGAMLEFPVGTDECAVCRGHLAEASKALKVGADLAGGADLAFGRLGW